MLADAMMLMERHDEHARRRHDALRAIPRYACWSFTRDALLRGFQSNDSDITIPSTTPLYFADDERLCYAIDIITKEGAVTRHYAKPSRPDREPEMVTSQH